MKACPEGDGRFVAVVLILGGIAFCLMMRYM